MYFTYIIYSSSTDKYYIGSCSDLERRVLDHNTGHSKFTKTGKPWVLKWSTQFDIRSAAVVEERRIKNKKSRKYIEFLIQSQG